MAIVTLADLEPLLGHFGGDGMVLSCYADLTLAEGFRLRWQAPFQAKADTLWKAIGEDGRARQELDRNLSAVQRALEAPEARGARWMAVFSSDRRGFFHTVQLDVPVETELVLDGSPYLVPLLEAMHRRREYLVVHTDTHRGRLFAATPGSVRLLEEIDEDVPKKQHSAGERWGQSQATIARHREDRIHHYRKELVARIEHFWLLGRYAGLILLGEHEVLVHLRKSLPARLAECIIREAPEPWYERASEVEETIHTAVLWASDADEAKTLEGVADRLREERAIAAGPRAVLDALQSGRIGAGGYGLLLFGPDPREVVGRCTACRSLAFDAPAICPRCQAPCAEANLWEELLLTALKRDIATRFVKDRNRLARHGGVVGILPKAQASERT